jgi:hypothetical protein
MLASVYEEYMEMLNPTMEDAETKLTQHKKALEDSGQA